MILHYLSLDDHGKTATPKPALVMGVDEQDPPNLDLQVFRHPHEGAGQEHMTRVHPASSATGSGWAWPEWMAAPEIVVPPLLTERMRKLRKLGDEMDNMRPGTVSKVPPGGDKTGQEGSVILLVLGSVLVAGLLSTALGL